ETYGGIKDVKVSGQERAFLDRFTSAARRHAVLEVMTHTTRRIPKYFLEAVAFGGIIAIVLYLLGTGRPTSAVLSIVTLYAFACYRLIPAVQQIYEAISQLKYSLPSLQLLEESLHQDEALLAIDKASPLGLQDKIELKGVKFTYPDAATPSLDGIDLRIYRGTSSAIVGSTGSGKTTVLD